MNRLLILSSFLLAVFAMISCDESEGLRITDFDVRDISIDTICSNVTSNHRDTIIYAMNDKVLNIKFRSLLFYDVKEKEDIHSVKVTTLNDGNDYLYLNVNLVKRDSIYSTENIKYKEISFNVYGMELHKQYRAWPNISYYYEEGVSTYRLERFDFYLEENTNGRFPE